jgi:uncharacterized protein YhbP (UPF0306 family)
MCLLDVLLDMLVDCKERLASKNVGNMRNALQGKSNNHPTIRKALIILTAKLKRGVTAPMGGQEVDNTLYGLQDMSTEHAEVRGMLSALAGTVAGCTEVPKAQHVGNALYGLQGMSSEHVEVRDTLSALAGTMAGCTEVLKAQGVGNALYGLQGMSSEHAVVRGTYAVGAGTWLAAWRC